MTSILTEKSPKSRFWSVDSYTDRKLISLQLKAQCAKNRNSLSPAQIALSQALFQINTNWHNQYPILGYIMDFYHRPAKLAVEINDEPLPENQRFNLKYNKYKLLRYTNQQVLDNPKALAVRLNKIADLMVKKRLGGKF